ncbi:ribosomal protein S21 [Labrenzia sp. EL_126]|nr:ribosomal protein S21 [Labrenzia sp. EL_126]
MDWFRSWHGAPTDMKWLVIAKRSETQCNAVVSLFWTLLDYASQNAERGSIKGFDIETYSIFSGTDEESVERIMKAMVDKGVIHDDRISNWEKRQIKREDNSAERVRKHRETKKKKEKRNVTQCNAPDKRREEENIPPIPPHGGGGDLVSVDDQFEEWYAEYPHKVGKAAALKAFKTAIRKTDLKTLNAARDRYIREKPEDRSWCNPSTWLNQERWLDVPAAAPSQHTHGGQVPPVNDYIQLLNHNQASRSAVIAKLRRWFVGQMSEWRYTPAWSDDHPPGHPDCVIPPDIIAEAQTLTEAKTQSIAG